MVRTERLIQEPTCVYKASLCSPSRAFLKNSGKQSWKPLFHFVSSYANETCSPLNCCMCKSCFTQNSPMVRHSSRTYVDVACNHGTLNWLRMAVCQTKQLSTSWIGKRTENRREIERIHGRLGD